MPDTSDTRTRSFGFIGRVLIVLGLASLVFLLWQLRSMLLLIFGAILVCVIIRALARRILRYLPVPDGVAVAISVLSITAALGLGGWLFGEQISAEVEEVAQNLPDAWTALEQRLVQVGLDGELQQAVASIRDSAGAVLANAGRFVLAIGGGITDAIVVIVGGVYLAAQPGMYRRGTIRLFPPRRRDVAADALDKSGKALRLWLKGQLISMTVVGVLTGLGLWLLGVPGALALGLIAALLEFIPLIGPIAAAVPGVLLALAVDPMLAVWTALLYLVIQHVEGNVLQPLVQQYAVHLPPVVLLFSLIGFGLLFGALGVLLAAPLTVVTYVLVQRLYVEEALEREEPRARS